MVAMKASARCLSKFIGLGVIAGSLALALPLTAAAQANTCIQDAYNGGTGNKTLSCTANDVSLASASNVVVFQGGISGAGNENKCIANGTFSFTANFAISTTSSSARSNIGVFFAGGSQTQALTGTCSDAILSQTHPCAPDPITGKPTTTCGSTEYEELDKTINGETAALNGCGDTSSGDGNGTGIQHSVLEVDGVTCPATGTPCPAGSGLEGQTCMALNYCTSWYQPAKQMPVCESPTWSWVNTAIPGTSSKCDCSIVYVPVQPITPAVTATKACNIGGSDLTTCVLPDEGGTVTYKIGITNTTPSGQGGVILDQICDDQYGTVYRNTAAPSTLTTCTSGSTGTINASSFACSISPNGNGEYDIATSAICSFTVNHGENLSVTDIATVYTQSDVSAGTPATPVKTKSVTVTSSDAPSTAKTSLGLEPGPQAACVTVRFDVTAQNTSAADEVVTLDSSTTTPALQATGTFGDITSLHGTAAGSGSVLGTTCGAPVAAGLGSLIGSPGAGAFPQKLKAGTDGPPSTNGGTYSCMFDGVICGVPNGNNVPNCAEGLTVQPTVTPNVTGDDVSPAPADTIKLTTTPFTANICLIQSGS